MRFVLVLLTALIWAYYFFPVQVSGTVYIVTNSATVRTLPLTEIKVYPLKQFRAAFYLKQAFVSEHCIGAKDEASAAKALLEKGPVAREDYEQSVVCSPRNLISSIELEPKEILITDQLGNFTFSLSRLNDVVLVAMAERQLPLEKERYLWLVPVSAHRGFTVAVELNNLNQVVSSDIRDIAL
ncbi:hypothetical protein MJ923_14890 [Shewanella sp. 3B26]|uniref:Uncharacterized protein n=1 Tax=Shewanella zhuhaiensis TaxID=2919576 RepID=A0AAJ1F1J4_9GAMM|nr:hypothetical protein [Shewanella zhuhaiensis]MCH4295593.1 hypothetical protein [Shewanella zhuhaiensis]